MMRTAATAILSLSLFGCAANVGMPQTRDEFVSAMKAGGLFRNSEQITVNRSLKSAAADVREYASKCLDVRVTRKLPREAVSSTTYRPQFTIATNGVASLSVQELYGDKPDSGAPPGGLFSFVAEMRAEGSNATRIDVYYLTSRGAILDSLKRWLEGRKDRCPALD